MELRSARRLGVDGLDRISALPDDLILLVLARLPCASAAVRTGVLSRQWRGIWARQRLRQIVFSEVPFIKLQAALRSVPIPPPAVTLLDIRARQPRLSSKYLSHAARVKSLLRAAGRLEPEELVVAFFSHSWVRDHSSVVDLPCFHRATSITLDLFYFVRCVPGVEFPLLETLSLSSCTVDLDALLSCCPRLRTLRLSSVRLHEGDLRVNCASLQELVLDPDIGFAYRVSIDTPVLKQLTICLTVSKAVPISVIAPMVEKASWQVCYTRETIGTDCWSLDELRLQASEGLPSLLIHAYTSSYIFDEGDTNIVEEIEKHMVAAFSVLELCLTTVGHVYGALVFHLLGSNRISSCVQSLKIILRRPAVEQVCSQHCDCGLISWRTEMISLTALEEVQIDGFEGGDHELDFLNLVSKCAPRLKKFIVKLPQHASADSDICEEIYRTFLPNSSVECYVYPSPESEWCMKLILGGSRVEQGHRERGEDFSGKPVLFRSPGVGTSGSGAFDSQFVPRG